MATLVFVVAAATSHSPAQNVFWYSCRDAKRESCISHVMPKHRGQHEFGFWQAKKAAKYVVFPMFRRHVARHVQAAYRQVTRAVRAAYTVPMLVTYYLATGNPMANGVYPSVGWAACGYDLPLGARVSVPGVGVLTCGDRIGFDPWHHIDVFGVALGSGYRNVTVLR